MLIWTFLKMIIIIVIILLPAGISTVSVINGHRGHSVQINCSYKSGYETNMKYLCRGECSPRGIKDIPVQSGSAAKDQRFSLMDDVAARVFTITITDLRKEDGGRYWCGVKRTGPDVYTEVLLLVKTVQTQPTFLSPYPTAGFIILYVCIPLLVSGITISAVVIFCKWRKTRDVQSSSILRRAVGTDGGGTDHEYNPPGKQHHIVMSHGYQSLHFNDNQSDSVYQTLKPNSNQLNSVYQSLHPNTNQSDSAYETLNHNTNQSL
ncbi:uncharacterized protein [Salminus brasiliensis]|uniref:uncharacterized protein isoform X2 n=1 Tax=Salminus brasiliensis TaxID=930266 RepID=UPI003B831724